MQTTRRFVWVMAVLMVGLTAACVANTRAAVKNDTGGAITVVLKSADGKVAHTFEDIAPSATTPFMQVGFETFEGIMVEIVNGAGQGGAVTFEKTKDHTVSISEGAAPAVDGVENPDNTFW